MIHASTADLATAIQARLIGSGEREIAGVAIDSRRVQPGNLFVALAGERVDGHDFVDAAQNAGAAAALVEHSVACALPQLLVKNSAAALGEIARRWRLCCPARIVAITGSNGKTTVKNLTAAILAAAGPCHATSGNLNNEIGLPLSLAALPESARFAVLEMGAGQPGDIASLAAIAFADVALVNNIAPAHLERMLSLDGIAATKGAIYSALPEQGIAVINGDDAYADYFTGLAGNRRVLRFALDHPAEVRGRILESGAGTRLAITTPLGEIEVNLALAGRHNAMNALAATAAALAAGAHLGHVQSGLESVTAASGRLQAERLASGITLIDDSYNANPASTRAAIEVLANYPAPRWLVLGDMRELGPEAPELHTAIGHYAAQHGIDALFTVGALSAHAAAAFGSTARPFIDQPALIAALRAELTTGATVLVKGSRGSAMEHVVAALRGHDQGGRSDAA